MWSPSLIVTLSDCITPLTSNHLMFKETFFLPTFSTLTSYAFLINSSNCLIFFEIILVDLFCWCDLVLTITLISFQNVKKFTTLSKIFNSKIFVTASKKSVIEKTKNSSITLKTKTWKKTNLFLQIMQKVQH